MALIPIGCQHVVLQRKVDRQASKLPDLYYIQVLNNIAAFSANPGALPHFANPDGGTTQVQRNGDLGSSVGFTGNLTSFFFSSLSFSPRIGTASIESWATKASNEPEELYLMRCVYQRTVGHCSADCETMIERFFGRDHASFSAMQPGWYGVGGKHDVPKCVAYVGHWCDTYVWVTPEHVDELARLVIAMTDLATADPTEFARKLAGDDKVGKLKDQITYLSGILHSYGENKSPHVLRNKLDALVRDYIEEISKKNVVTVVEPDGSTRQIESTDALPGARARGPLPARNRKPEAPFFPPLQPLQPFER
jgi:hypothetical protein